eukprot:TRINITY_DN1490_c0_g1_i7.p1 TRINITY_DN1490_c0_g1~~TRINITY_DN1490_c0_g1_i7.p1  ORF type:complete len:650 (-),score=127.67 TRINITY_DN1490_c0_g1_i7:112-2061(-)
MYSASVKSTDPLELLLTAEALDARKGLLHASVIPLKSGTRKSSTFVCAIDISGSMGGEASLNKGAEIDSFSRLDLVKHSIRTVIHMLNPEDNLCLITFDDNAVVKFQIQPMDQEGKKRALDVLEQLEPMYSTNIWGALKSSIDQVLKSPVCKSTNNYVLLFTDGEPNVNPPEGIMSALWKEIGSIPDYYEQFTIHTFGYGYSLDSKLLYDISVVGNGIYNYIPDCTMIGTIFVNFLSTILSTSVANAKLTITPPAGTKLKSLGFYLISSSVMTGPIQFGQTRDFIFRYHLPAGKDFEFTATLEYGTNTVTRKVTGLTSKQSKTTSIEWVRSMYCRYLFKELNFRLGASKLLAKPYLQYAKQFITSSPFAKDEQLKLLLRDIESSKEVEGQVTKAFSKPDWLKKWGAHYTRSLVRAHQLQMCHNFKDPGVQAYGGEYFKALQDKADEAFCNIPAPKPSIKKQPFQKFANYSPPSHNMREYMDYGLGCFDGEGEVILTSGRKKVKELVRGDEVVCAEGKVAKVVALIVTKVGVPVELVELKGVKLTAWHPVQLDRTWKFPINVKKGQLELCDAVYNLILDRNHIVLINGLEVVTLGHGFKGDTVVEHDYFGTRKVIEDMKKFKGWEKGTVMIEQWKAVRDPVTQLVQGLIH